MADLARTRAKLEARLSELAARAGAIEEDLRGPLEADWEEQAANLADDEPLAGVDSVLHDEISQIRRALLRIDKGSYGSCERCGADIGERRLEAIPPASVCIGCA